MFWLKKQIEQYSQGGHLAVVTKQRTTNNNSISKDKENHTVPDGDNVWEKHDEAEKVAEPRTHKPLHRYHDNRQNHLGQEQGLGEAVQL